ncbi:hypothetical protein Q8F55_005290 [Vanrija albida]|uniref:Uncharacterized protein n=1 Tax=Vanrija albida TaxID=181172 RepID=A0ABR3Q1E1_9TREE
MDAAQVALPATASALLAALLLYQLWPLLSLIPSLNLPALLIPAAQRNLPREFFGLPPRREAKPSAFSKLGLRGAISLTLAAHAAVALVGGWVYLVAGAGRTVALAVALTPIPACITLLAGYSLALGVGARRNGGEEDEGAEAQKDTNKRFGGWLLAGGGVTHATVFPRIFPLAFVPTALTATLAGTMPSHARQILLGTTSVLAAASIGLTAVGVYRARRQSRPPIFLASRPDSPMADTSDDAIRRMMEGSSWLTSFSHNDTMPSAFDLSPSTQAPTPPSKEKVHTTPERQRICSKTQNGSPTSWISSRNSADSHSSVPEWTFESPEKPRPAVRKVSRSPSPPQSPVHGNVSMNADSSNPNTTGANSSSNMSHSFVTASAGGSILGEYEASLFAPLPRGFESIASMPPLPSLPSAASLRGPASMVSHSGLIPRGSTWTLAASSESLPTPSTAYTRLMTPALQPHELEHMEIPLHRQESSTSLLGGRMIQPSLSSIHTPKKRTSSRPPPPPPLPTDLPLPPTPTHTPRDTWVLHDDNDVELYLDYWVTGDWVTVLPGGERVEDWGRSDRGAVSLAVLCVLACYALDMPLLVFGPTTAALWSFAVSISLPAPVLCVASYLMRCRGKAQVYRKKKTSTSSADTHVSLALMAEVDLPFPIDLSPKLTPPLKQPFRTDGGEVRTDKILRPKPSLTTFGFIPRVPGYSPPSQLPFAGPNQLRRHTMYTGAEIDAVEKAAEKTLKNMHKRRSQEIWSETGQAKEGLGAAGRAMEMLKPVPALCVMEDSRRNSGMLRRLRGGIVSMLAGDVSVIDEERAIEGTATQATTQATTTVTQVTIQAATSATSQTASPPPSHVRHSGISHDVHDSPAEIRTASVARLSASPSFVLGLEGQEDKVNTHLGWLPAALLPALLSQRKPAEQKDVKKTKSVNSLRNAVTMRKKSSASKVGRSKASTIKSVPSDSQPDVRLPFSPSLDNIASKTPSSYRRGSKKRHRNFSSIDMSTDSHAPMSSTPHVRGRHIRQASSLSLPAVDFSRGDFFSRPSDTGIDLPPVPVFVVPRTSTAPSQRIYMDTIEAIAANQEMDMSIANNAALARLLLADESAAAAEWAALQNSSFMRDVLIAQAFSNSGYRSTAPGTPASRARTVSDNDTYVSAAIGGPRRARASVVYREPPTQLVVAVGDSDDSRTYTPPRTSGSYPHALTEPSFVTAPTTNPAGELTSEFEDDASPEDLYGTSASTSSGFRASLRSLGSVRSIRSALSRARTHSTASVTASENATTTTTDESLGPFPPPLPPMPSLPVYLYRPPVQSHAPLPAAHPHPPPLAAFPADSNSGSFFGSLPSALDSKGDLRLQPKDSNTSLNSDTSFGETYKATVGRAMRASVITLSTEALVSLASAVPSSEGSHESSADSHQDSSEAGHSTRSMIERPASPTPSRGAGRATAERPSTPATPTQPGLRPLRLVQEVAKRNSLVQAKSRSPSPTETEFESRPLPRPPSQSRPHSQSRPQVPVDRRYSDYRESLISAHRFSVVSSHEAHTGVSGYDVGNGHRPTASTDTFGHSKPSKTSTQSGRGALSVLTEKSNSMGGSRVSLVSADKENAGPGYMLGGRKRRSKASNGPVIRV